MCPVHQIGRRHALDRRPVGLPNSPSDCLDCTGEPLFGFMGELHLRSTVRGFDRSLAVPGDIDGPVEQDAHPLAMVSCEGVAAAGWWQLGSCWSMATVPCFTLKRPRVQVEERWAPG